MPIPGLHRSREARHFQTQLALASHSWLLPDFAQSDVWAVRRFLPTTRPGNEVVDEPSESSGPVATPEFRSTVGAQRSHEQIIAVKS